MYNHEGDITRERMEQIALHLLDKRIREIKERVLPLSFEDIQREIEILAKELNISYGEARRLIGISLFEQFINFFDRLSRDNGNHSP